MITSPPESFSQYKNAWKAFSLSLGLGILFFLTVTLQYGYEGSFLLLHKSWGGFWDSVMPHVTHLADGAIVGGVFGIVYARTKPGLVTGLMASLILVAVSVALLKQGVFNGWHRPASVFGNDEVHLLSLGKETQFSFPSGHSAAAACLGWFIATVRPKMRWGALVGVTAVLLGFTRVYIGVHFPGDVAAGLVVGLVMAVVGTILSNRAGQYLIHQSTMFQKRIQYALTGLALLFLIFGIANTIIKYYLS